MTNTAETFDRPWETLGPTWVEVDLDVLAGNLHEIAAFIRRPLPEESTSAAFAARRGLRAPSGPPNILIVVKGDGYGHGAVQTAKTALEAGADMLGVCSVLEGLELRQAGINTPVLVFNPMTTSEAPTVVRTGLTPTVSDLEAAERISAELQTGGRGSSFPVHLAIDTGMSRYGLAPADAPGFASKVAALPGLSVEGVYTHFSAGADRGRSSVATMRRQFDIFARTLSAIEAGGLAVPLRHAACSWAIIELPESYLDMVRVGNLFYGFIPGGPERKGPKPAVREAFVMATRVLETRQVPAGTGVGYGPDVRVRRRSRLATVPVGYADGLGVDVRTGPGRVRDRFVRFVKSVLRRLDRLGLLLGPLERLRRHAWSRSDIFHRGRPVEVLGRISMQQAILDVTNRPEIQAGSLLTVQVRRVLANPRLARVYYSGGRPVLARTASGVAEAAAGWDPIGSGTVSPVAAGPADRGITP
jgi:alanine racemase